MKPVKMYPREAEKAYDYKRNFMTSIIIVLIVLIAVFRVHFNPQEEIKYTEREQPRVELRDIVQTEQPKLPPPPQRPRTPAAVPNEVIIEDQYFDFDIDRTEPTGPPPPPAPAPGEAPAEEQDEEPEFFIAVEEMPTIIGGIDALYDALEYPVLARRAGIEGRVVVQFIIDEEGNVHNPQVIRGAGAGLDEAAVRAIQQLRFTPGRQRGRAVPVQYTIPVTFILDRD